MCDIFKVYVSLLQALALIPPLKLSTTVVRIARNAIFIIVIVNEARMQFTGINFNIYYKNYRNISSITAVIVAIYREGIDFISTPI